MVLSSSARRAGTNRLLSLSAVLYPQGVCATWPLFSYITAMTLPHRLLTPRPPNAHPILNDARAGVTIPHKAGEQICPKRNASLKLDLGAPAWSGVSQSPSVYGKYLQKRMETVMARRESEERWWDHPIPRHCILGADFRISAIRRRVDRG